MSETYLCTYISYLFSSVKVIIRIIDSNRNKFKVFKAFKVVNSGLPNAKTISYLDWILKNYTISQKPSNELEFISKINCNALLHVKIFRTGFHYTFIYLYNMRSCSSFTSEISFPIVFAHSIHLLDPSLANRVSPFIFRFPYFPRRVSAFIVAALNSVVFVIDRWSP